MNRWARVAMGLLAAFGVLAALAGGAMAQEPSPAGMMAEANQRFERGEFAEAAQQYEALVGLGYRDAAVHYNLGNAYLESGDLGQAILNYLRSEELSPRDPDLIANLELARGRTVDQLQAEGDSLVASVADFGRFWATATEFAIAALLLWAVAGVAICVLIIRPIIRRPRDFARRGCRCLSNHAGAVGPAGEYAHIQSIRKHRCGDCENRGSVERTGASVRRGICAAQRSPGPAGGLPPRLAAGRPARRRAGGMAPISRRRGRGEWRRWVVGEHCLASA